MDSDIKILLQGHLQVVCYCFLSYALFALWHEGWGAENHISALSVCFPVRFCQLERQEKGARICSFLSACCFCYCLPSGFVPASFHSQTSFIIPLRSGSTSQRQHLLLRLCPTSCSLLPSAWGTPVPAPPQRFGIRIPQPLPDSMPVTPYSSLWSLDPGVGPVPEVTISVTTAFPSLWVQCPFILFKSSSTSWTNFLYYILCQSKYSGLFVAWTVIYRDTMD